MASTTISVNPRKKTAQSPPLPLTNQNRATSANQNKGTVLLRNPLPKYSFEQKPKAKTVRKEKLRDNDQSDKISSNSSGVKSKASSSNLTEIKSGSSDNQAANVPLPSVPQPGQIGTLVNSFPQTMVYPSSPLLKGESESEILKSDSSDSTVVTKGASKEKPVNKVGPISISSENKLTHSVSDSLLGAERNVQSHYTPSQLVSASVQPSTINSGAPTTQVESETGNSSILQHGSTHNVSVQETAVNQSTINGTQSDGNCNSKIQQLEEEKQLLKNQLEVQLQVNQELKKLLVASVGEDLQHRVERLTRDRFLLSQEIGDYNKRITDDWENMDQISIQADMWRSKYLACRVMADELASSKAFYTMQVQECQRTLEQMLNERHQLRANLYDTYRGLEQIQEAFDPLHAHVTGPRLLMSKNVIDLARTNQQLAESIKYRLLPSHVTSAINSTLEPDWHDYLTSAEAHAKELLSREMRPEDFRCLVPHSGAPSSLSVDRFHPMTNYDNLTINVCCKCKGEIRIV